MNTSNQIGPNENLFEMIERLEKRVEFLEKENIELTNCIYEVENRLESKIYNLFD